MKAIFLKIKKSFEFYGAGKTFKKIVKKALNSLYYAKTSVLMSRRFDLPFAPASKDCPGFVLSEGSIEELREVDYLGEKRQKNFLYNKNLGARCCIGRANGEIVSFSFMTTLPYRDAFTSVLISPENGQVYQFEGEIRPADRGKAYGYHHSVQYAEKMRNEGHTEAICLVEPANAQSWKLHLRMGFEPKRVCRHAHFLGKLSIVRWSDYSIKKNVLQHQ